MTKKVKFVVTVIWWVITLFIMGAAMYHIGYDEGHYDSVKLYKPHMESMLYENRKLEEQLKEQINTENELRKMLLEETLNGGESLSES